MGPRARTGVRPRLLLVAAFAASGGVLSGHDASRVGPGPVSISVARGGYSIALGISPNGGTVDNAFTLRLRRGGRPVRGAVAAWTATNDDMPMPVERGRYAGSGNGVYRSSAASFPMLGRWRIVVVVVVPRRGAALRIELVDRVER